jgi:NAD(P)-dependent dehydrogenase (short-subunit alcohol dehydrogenase family)
MVETQDLQASGLFSVEGWVCLITSGGTGIGLMCAQAFAANGTSPHYVAFRVD